MTDANILYEILDDLGNPETIYVMSEEDFNKMNKIINEELSEEDSKNLKEKLNSDLNIRWYTIEDYR